jgi:terminal uridylyltransferase
LKLLVFYSIDFGFKKTFISIRRHKRISKSKVKMYTKKIAIEDPFSLKQSLSRNLMTQTNKYIINVISKACLYFVSNMHCYSDSKLEIIKSDKYKIVDKLIEETGILDARKSNKELDEDVDEYDENYMDTAENDDATVQHDDSFDEDEDDDEDDDLFYLKKKQKNDIKSVRKNGVPVEKLDNKLSKDIDSLLKLNEFSSLNGQLSSIETTTTSSSISTPVENLELESNETENENNEENDVEDVDLDEDNENEDEINTGEEIEDLDQEDDDDDDDEDEESENTEENDDSDDYPTESTIRNKSKYRLDSNELADKNLNSNFNDVMRQNSQNVVKSCLKNLIEKVVELNESIYECIPAVDLKMLNKVGENNKSKNFSSLFKFTANDMGFAKNPPMICTLCNKDGHLQAECPQDRLPKLEELPVMTDHWREVLTKVCNCIMGKIIVLNTSNVSLTFINQLLLF